MNENGISRDVGDRLSARHKLRAAALNTIKRSKPIYFIARKLRFAWGALVGARFVEGIQGRVHRNDTMLSVVTPKNIEGYNQVGETVVQILEESILKCGRQWSDIGSVFEIGCNYGRIIRRLITKVDTFNVYGCDILKGGPKFCAAEFGINALPPTFDADFPKTRSFDLVYLISVFTHLSDDAIKQLLLDIDKCLNPNGVLVFTTLGPVSASKLALYGPHWHNKNAQIGNALDTSGSYFEEYDYGTDSLGMAWHTKDRISQIAATNCPALKLQDYVPARLDAHQDIFVFQKLGSGPHGFPARLAV